MIDLMTGQKMDFPNPSERREARVKRMRAMVWLSIGGMQETAAIDHSRFCMYTLTYKQVGEWQPRHISSFCRWLRGKGITDYVWVVELQRRGAVHYHLLALLQEGQRWEKPNEDSGGWARGFTWVTDGLRKPYYIMKYMTKGKDNGQQATIPKGIRLHGVSRSTVRKFSGTRRAAYVLGKLPYWFRRDPPIDSTAINCHRVIGGVDCGRYIVYSQYSTKPLAPIDQVARDMWYTYASGGGLPQQ